MDDTRGEKPPHQWVMPKWARNLLIVAAILFVLFGVPWLILDVIGRSALSQQIQAMKDAGQPLTLREYYDQLPPLPDAENSALIIESLAAQLVAASTLTLIPDLPYFGRAELPAWSEPWPGATLGAIDEFVAKNAELIERLDPLRDLPRGRFHIELEPNPIGTGLPHLYAVRAASRLETLSIIHDVSLGHLDSALDRCRTVFCIASSLWDDPYYVSSIYSSYFDEQACKNIERILSFGDIAPTRLASLQAIMEEHEIHQANPNGIRGERLCLIGTHEYARTDGLQLLASASSDNTFLLPRAYNWLLSGWFRMNQVKMLELMGDITAALDSPKSAIEAAAKFDHEAQALGEHYFVAKYLMPPLTGTVTKWARQVAQLRSARTGLAAERFRLANARWPETLDELVPEYLDAVPLDPFDEKPLRYRVDTDKITIYSIHENENDDNGEISDDPKQQPSPDIGFRLLNPELRSLRLEPDTKTTEDTPRDSSADQP